MTILVHNLMFHSALDDVIVLGTDDGTRTMGLYACDLSFPVQMTREIIQQPHIMDMSLRQQGFQPYPAGMLIDTHACNHLRELDYLIRGGMM
jgi:hypothetical protein